MPEWGYARYGKTNKDNLQHAYNFKDQLLANTGTAYNAVLNESGWTDQLKRFCNTAADYEIWHTVFDSVAYNSLGGRNNANEFEFAAYMLDHYGLSVMTISNISLILFSI